jgi:hypothetical protein
MRKAGRFLWLDWAQASGRVYASPNAADSFTGEHDGYKRFGVTHRRTVRWLPDCGWIVIDDMQGAGERDLRLHWLAADLPFEICEEPFQVIFQSAHSPICWNIFCSTEGNSTVVRAGKSVRSTIEKKPPRNLSEDDAQLLGWEALTYGELQPAVSLVYQTRAKLPLRLVTVVLTNQACQLESRRGEVVISSNDRVIERVNLSPKNLTSETSAPTAR